MQYINVRIHYPTDGHAVDILEVTAKVADTAATHPGYVDTAAWFDKQNDQIVIVSVWESETQAMTASKAMHPMVANLPSKEWERQPALNFQQLERTV